MNEDRKAGLRDVARRAEVSIASASRVLSGRPGAAPELRDRVLRAAESLGYVPNMLARGLRRSRSMTVGFVASDIANPLIAGIFRGAEAVLGPLGYSLLLTDSDGNPSNDAARIAVLGQRQVDGIIALPVSEDDPATLASLRAFKAPLVVVDRDLPEDIRASRILSDHRVGMSEAARCLLDLGHRHVSLIAGRNVRPARERAASLASVFDAASHPPAFASEIGEMSEAHVRATLTRLLDQATPPSAIILGGNQLLVGALRFLRERGIKPGRDVSLITCDDVNLGQLHDPPIAAVARDIKGIGARAAELLTERMEAPDAPPRDLILPTWFVRTASCCPPAR